MQGIAALTAFARNDRVTCMGLGCSFHSLAMTGYTQTVIARALVPVAISYMKQVQ